MSDDNKFEKNSPAYIENLWNEYKKIKGYDEGGEVKPDDSKGSGVLKTIGDALSKAFDAPPKPSPTPTPLEEKYRKIREQNRKNFDDPVNNPSENYYKPDQNYADGGKVHKSMAQRQAEDIQVIDPQSGKVSKTVPKYTRSPASEPQASPEPSPSPSPDKEETDKDYTDTSKSLGKRLKAYGNAVDDASDDVDKSVSSYAAGGPVTATQPQQQQPGAAPIMDIPRKMNKGGKAKSAHNKKNLEDLKRAFAKFISEEESEAPEKYNKGGKIRHYADGSDGEVEPNDTSTADISSANDQSDTDTSDLADRNDDSRGISKLPEQEAKYIESKSGKKQRIEKVEGKEQDVSSSQGPYKNEKNQLDTGYEEQQAEDAADNSTQGQIEQELSGGPKDDSQTSDDQSQEDQASQPDVRQLPADTISHIDALADVPPGERSPASTIPPEAQSADEAAQAQTPQPQAGQTPSTATPQQGSLMDQLKAAQGKQKLITALQGIGEGGALIGAGLAGRSGVKVTPVPGSVFRDANAAAMPLQHFQQQLGIDKEDPNSAISKVYQDHIIQGLPNATPQQITNIRGSSANNLDKFLPQQTKLIYGQNAIQAKKDLLDTRLNANKEMNKNKQDFTAVQKSLDRADRDKIAAMAQEGMKQRFDTPTLDRITNEVRNDPLLKPVILKKASVDESLHLLDNATTVHPALLSDANFAFTQAMNLQPGATTQKRYDASKITELNQRVHSWVANNLNNPNADMRSDDPALFNLLHGYLDNVSKDYGDLIDQTQSTVLNTKKAAYNALGRKGIVSGIEAMQGSLGNAGRGPANAVQNGQPQPQAGGQQQAPQTVVIRQKSTGMTKTLPADRAQKYLSNPDFEKVQ